MQFVKLAGNVDVKFGRDICPTAEIETATATVDNTQVVLVDVPGFSGTSKYDMDTLRLISAYAEVA